jgi:hypothetical protein
MMISQTVSQHIHRRGQFWGWAFIEPTTAGEIAQCSDLAYCTMAAQKWMFFCFWHKSSFLYLDVGSGGSWGEYTLK